MAKLQSFDNMPELEPVRPLFKVLEEDGNSNPVLPKERNEDIVEEKDSNSVGRSNCIGRRLGTHNHQGAGAPGSDLNFRDDRDHGNSSTISQLPPHQKGKMVVVTGQRREQEKEAVLPKQKTTTSEEPELENFGTLGRKLAAEGIIIDMLHVMWMTFDPDEFPPSAMQAEAEKFLTNYLPSKVNRCTGYDWISVHAPYGDDELSSSEDEEEEDEEEEDEEEEDGKDVHGLKEAWAKLNESGEEINLQKIQQLAVAHRILSGKWMVFRKAGIHADLTWERIFRATIIGRLGMTAKVSTADKDEPRHVICVYNENFTDNAEVRELESRLRAIGIRCTMQYKPDVFTYLGVYRGNEWNLRPVMYVSDFDLRKNSSTIVSNYDQV